MNSRLRYMGSVGAFEGSRRLGRPLLTVSGGPGSTGGSASAENPHRRGQGARWGRADGGGGRDKV